MHALNPIALSNFFVAGVNYKKSDASVRSEFSINTDQYEQLLARASGFDVQSFFVLSTCNRTEIYGFAHVKQDLIDLLTSQTAGSRQNFTALAYTKQGIEAMEHLFHVAAGIDSQILGDYEIVGQVKQAVNISKKNNCIHPVMERMINEVLQSSKRVRTSTGLSGGTVSVSFAAVQYIRRHNTDGYKNKILLAGTGKFGSNLCKNIADYLPGYEVTLVNRTAEKAASLASLYNFSFDQIENIEACVKQADIILVTTNADEPIILQKYFTGKPQMVIDLSVPCNVEKSVADLSYVTVADVDQLSRIKDETLSQRTLEIPKAKQIIAEHIHAFMEWHLMRQHVPVLKAVKSKLLTMQTNNLIFTEGLHTEPEAMKDAEYRIQKVINGMAVKMKTKNQKGCNYIEAINDFITPASN
jgi:glutamyl-tRNA reductase